MAGNIQTKSELIAYLQAQQIFFVDHAPGLIETDQGVHFFFYTNYFGEIVAGDVIQNNLRTAANHFTPDPTDPNTLICLRDEYRTGAIQLRRTTNVC